MLKRYLCILGLWALTISAFAQSVQNADTFHPEWYSTSEPGQVQIHLYFFHSKTCPHCKRAKPFLSQLEASYPWLKIHSYEISTSPENAVLYNQMAKSLGETVNAVPGFLFCEQMQVGYDNEEGVGAFLKKQLEICYEKHASSAASSLLPPPAASILSSPKSTEVEKSTGETLSEVGHPATVTAVPSPPTETTSSSSPPPLEKVVPPLQIPWLGTVNAQQFSLPVLTLVIAGLDAFNPCAFFVLLFLLSLLVHTRKRSRMFLIGGIFVFFSGFIYFLFMAAWLNIFLWMGELQIITVIAGLIAILIALINIKDFFWFKVGVSLSIPDQAKPDLYQRMRRLVTSTELLPMLVSTVVLAIVANTYELLCTAGFPMVYTRILTLNQLPNSLYYLYLVFYNIVYVIPLLVIVLVFTYTLGSRKLAESEGRALKLMSGLMMLGLGGVLLIQPTLLTNMLASAAILGGAVVLGGLIVWVVDSG